MRRPTAFRRSSTGSHSPDAEAGLSTAARRHAVTATTPNDEEGFAAVDATSASLAGVSQGEGLTLIMQEHSQLCQTLTQWMSQQRKAVETQLAEQEHLINTLVQFHQQTVQGLKRSSEDAVACETFQTSGARLPASGRSGATLPATGDVGPEVSDSEAPLSKDNGSGAVAAAALAHLEDGFTNDEALLDSWRRCSGLHTVDKWVSNYHKHPAGWAALLMIQGIPEVTARLRNKVENYAIYSALFLSVSIALLTSPPSALTGDVAANQWTSDWWEIHLRRRIYSFCFGLGTALHMLSIMLAMAFSNALNEAARDSDVFRIFARGQGFKATVRTQRSFLIGCVADVLAIMAALTLYITWVEVLAGCTVLAAVTWFLLRKTKQQLFKNGSIVQYWREELGGMPDADDPYDLQVPADCFRRRAAASGALSKISEASPGVPDAKPQRRGGRRDGNQRGVARTSVAAIF
mmetsp:Transcript_36404/g.71968  ORF Transcript_36404/g.71968 Transcript_36404/m.71968 type:complete len:463 (-) Transcript_36404:115-1503(-)